MDEKNSSRMTSLGTQTIANGWISFAADPERKERCLARLREGELGPDNQPSDCAAGGKHRFSDELGVPETLAVVIDVLCWLRQSEGKISARAGNRPDRSHPCRGGSRPSLATLRPLAAARYAMGYSAILRYGTIEGCGGAT